MASAVTVIFGANSTQFQAELAKMQALTVAAGRRMASSAASGHMVGTTGIVRETAVIGREIAQGRGIGRILASLTLLTQYLGSASRAAQHGATSARLVADAYAEAALKANVAAVAAMRKAEASAAAAEMDGFEDAASIAAADANALEAQTANATAAALARKAEAAAADAAAQEADAAATAGAGISALGFAAIMGTVAIVAGLVYERIWGVKKLMDSLSFSGSDLRDDYVPMLKRHLNDARNAQKEVTDEVKKTVDQYNSAASAAKRQADATKEQFDHQKKMLDLQKQAELDRAKNPHVKEEIEARYSAQELDLEKRRQQAELADKLTEKTRLEAEAQSKLNQANAITVTTREEDQQTLGKFNQNAEAAEKFLKGGGVWEEFKKQAARDSGGVSMATINATEEAGQAAAQAAIAKRNKFADKVAANDEIRKTKEQLVKDAAKSAADAAKIGLDIPNIVSSNTQKLADMSEEAAAKLREEKARDLGRENDKGYSLNSQQKIGAYAATAPLVAQMAVSLRSIDHKVTPHSPPSNSPPGERKPQLGPTPKWTSSGWVAYH